jgi:hypothetical protein
MSEYDFSEAYARIQRLTGESSQSGLARALGVSQSSVWDAQRRAEGIPATWLLALVERYGANPTWIKHGAGPEKLRQDVTDIPLEALFAEIGRRLGAVTA